MFYNKIQIDRWVSTTVFEMKVFVGIHILMRILQFPRGRIYWKKDYRINIIVNRMAEDKFFEL